MKSLLVAAWIILAATDSLAGAAPRASRAVPERASRRELAAIRARAESAATGTLRLYEPRIDAMAAEVDLASMRDETLVASRLAVEFGTGVGPIMRERARVASRWSDFMIAHTVKANARRPISLEQILGLRRAGLAWTGIVYGLGLRPIQLVSAVRSQSRVATGLERPDGRVHAIAPLVADSLIAEHGR